MMESIKTTLEISTNHWQKAKNKMDELEADGWRIEKVETDVMCPYSRVKFVATKLEQFL